MNMGTILLIEDDADIREGVRVLLTSEGYSVLEADCGKQGLSLLNSNIDLVILDIMMPGISGIITCEEIRKVSNVPVLFLTAKAQESDKLLGLIVGGDDYLAKPFSYAAAGAGKGSVTAVSYLPGKVYAFKPVRWRLAGTQRNPDTYNLQCGAGRWPGY